MADFEAKLIKMDLNLVCCFAGAAFFFAPVFSEHGVYFGVIPWLVSIEGAPVRFDPVLLALSIVLWLVSLVLIPRLLKHLDSGSYVD